ncbi:RpnC/YadD family protein [Spirosoma gilvum]
MKSRYKLPSISQCDKIVKENLEAAIPALIERLLHIHPVESVELPDDLQHTKERKPDALKRILDRDGNTFILHLEFQVADDPDMIYRMGDYCVMLARTYRLSVRQYVLYMGDKRPKMVTELNTGDSIFRYRLLSFQQYSYQVFLHSDKPEEILFALLADFDRQSPQIVLEQMVNRIYETTTSSLAFERYMSQLRVLVQLRKLQPNLELVMEKLTQYFKEQEDPFFQKGQRLGFTLGLESGKKAGLEEGKKQGIEQGKKQGIEQGEKKGLEQGKRLVILNLLSQTSFSVAEIARLTDVSSSFVETIKKELGA